MSSQRIVIKIGTNVLQRPQSAKLDYNVISDLGEEIARLHHEKYEVILVSSGAVGAGRESCSLGGEVQALLRQQVLASVGQIRLMQIYSDFFHEQEITIAQLLLTHDNFLHQHSYLNIRRSLEELLHLGVLPIINENDVISTEELEAQFGDNDQLAVYVAALIEADHLFFLTVAPGLLSSAPNEPAKIIKKIEHFDPSLLDLCFSESSSGGKGGMRSKVNAAAKAMSLGMEVHIMDGKQPHEISEILKGQAIGTRFVACGKKLKNYEEYTKTMSLASFDDVKAGLLSSMNFYD